MNVYKEVWFRRKCDSSIAVMRGLSEPSLNIVIQFFF